MRDFYFNVKPMRRRNSSHGNFHYYPNDHIKFEKRDSFRIDLKGLSTLNKRIRDKHLYHGSGSIIKRILDARKEWEEFNWSLQAVIDNWPQELES